MQSQLSWMTQIQARLPIRLGGILAIIARAASPSQMERRLQVERGTSASGGGFVPTSY